MSDEISLKRLTRAAQEMYRAAWLRWCATDDLETKKNMQKAMDAVQPWCSVAGRPDAEWKRFADTLPGYNEYWDATVGALQEEVLRRLRQKNVIKPLPDDDDDVPPAG
jgi:hypothetical protein